jgi:hypothetical protein
MRYCNRLCLRRSSATHPLLCPAQNPASVPLLTFVRKLEWQAVHALAQCTSRILLANQQGEDALKTDWELVKGLAVLGMEQRFKSTGYVPMHFHPSRAFMIKLISILHRREPDQESWQQLFKLYIQAFREPKSVPEQKKLARLLKKPLELEIEKELFEYGGFLRGLGRMSLSMSYNKYISRLPV